MRRATSASGTLGAAATSAMPLGPPPMVSTRAIRPSKAGSARLVSDEERDLAEQSEKLGQGPTRWEVKKKLTALYCDKTLDFVARNKDRPWFVQLWLNDVHDPWAPDGSDLDAVRGAAADPEDARYLAAVRGMDRDLGRLFDRLEAMGEARDTLIVLTSDNGPASLPKYYRERRHGARRRAAAARAQVEQLLRRHSPAADPDVAGAHPRRGA